MTLAALTGLLSACGAGAEREALSGQRDRSALLSSPLHEFIPLADGTTDEAREVTRVAELLIARCMKEHGFDYDQPYLSELEIAGGEGLSRSEWAAAYGYGFSTSTAPTASPGPMERSAAEERAYDDALYGAHDEEHDGQEEVERRYDWSEEGCLGSAYHHATGGIDSVFADVDHGLILGEIEALTTIVDDDPAVHAVDAAWSDCMADRGIADLGRPADARERALAWWRRDSEEAAASTHDGQAVPNPDPQHGSADAREVVDRELELAVSDVECQAAVDHAEVLQQVRWWHERLLVEKYPDELAALRDAGDEAG